MKKYLLFSILSVFTFAVGAQLTAPLQTNPADSATGVFVNEKLTWNPSTGGLVTGYECHLDVDPNFSNPVSLPIHGTGALPQLLDYNQVYYWRVRAKNGSVNGPWSDTLMYTTFNDEFKNMLPKTPDQNPEFKLQWDTVSGSDSYTVELATNPSFTSPMVFLVAKPKPDSATGGRARLQLANLMFGTTYYWRVRSNHSLDQSAFSPAESFSIIASVNPIAPVDADVDKHAKTRLTCKNTNGVQEYRFQICDDPTFNENSTYFHSHIAYKKDFPPFFDEDGNLKIPNIGVDAEYLSYGTVYYWRVRGVNNTAVSSWSATRTFTTTDVVELTSPSDAAADLGNIGIEFKWVRSVGAEGYIMELDSNMNFTTPRFIETFGDTGTAVVLDVKKTTKEYFWRVKAIHFRDSTQWSPTRSFYGTPTGIANVNSEFGFSVYPNPAEELVYFNLSSQANGNAIIEIYNILGEKLDQVTMRDLRDGQILEYNTNSLQSGVYMVVINFNEQREVHRLSIK